MNTQRGSDSYLLFALNKNNAPDTPIVDLDDVDKIVYNIVSADLARDTEVVTIEESSASGNPQVPEAARIRTQGNVVYNLRGQNMLRILQHALWTRVPAVTPLTDKKELKSAAAYTTGTAIEITTNFREIGLAKASITLTGGSNFKSPATTGSVTIVGTGKNGEAQTEDVAYDAASNGAGEKKSNLLFATISSITVNDIESGTIALSADNEKSGSDLLLTTKVLRADATYPTGVDIPIGADDQADESIVPAKVVLKFDKDADYVVRQTAGKVLITGTDMDDLEIDEEIVIDSDDVEGTVRSQEFFKTVTSVQITDIEGGKLEISVDNERKEVILEPSSNPLFGTMELNRGAGAPMVFDRIITTGFSVAVSGNGAVQLTVNYAGRTNKKKTIEGGVRSGEGLHGLPVEFKEVNDSVFLAYGTVVEFGGSVLPIRDMTLNVEQNYDVLGYLTGEREYATPEQNARVTAVLTGTVKYAYDETYSDTFIQNRFVENFALKCLRAPSGKAKDEMEFRFGRGKLSTDPDRVSISQGVVEQSIEISLLGSEGATVADYLKLFIRNTEGIY